MRQFFKILFASMLGFMIGTFLLFIFFIAILSASFSFSKQNDKDNLPEKGILEIRLTAVIPERADDNPFEGMDWNTFEIKKATTLHDIVESIDRATTNDHIKGIYLQLGISPNAYASLEEIRQALLRFKKSKKPIWAYGDMCDEHSYFVASAADAIYLNPVGMIEMNGFTQQVMYLKSMFEKAGIHPELIRHGKFKSAGEPLIADAMSNENRLQTQTFVGSLFETFCERISVSRKIDNQKLHTIIQELLVRNPADALTFGLIDGILYHDGMEAKLRKLTDTEEKENIPFISVHKFKSSTTDQISVSENKVAVLYCDGEIGMGKSNDGSVGSESICNSLRKIRNGNYKACVMRINSPGGSALASDIIWREVLLTQQKMPVYVSMGDVAASGGYYIAAPADCIYAQSNTITGSIGVFGVMFNAQELLNNKLGIHIETVNFGKCADLGKADRPLSDFERNVIQNEVDHIYNDFISHVAEGRKKSNAYIDSIGQGRVWSGLDAKKIGLVDAIGGLNDAIQGVVQKAKLSDYRIVNFPEKENPIEEIFESLGENMSIKLRHYVLKDDFMLWNTIQQVKNYSGFQTRMIENIDIR